MSQMTVNSLTAEINTPPALQGDGLHTLPPHSQIPAYVVDEYPACPDVWEHGSDKASSYFISLEAGKGMWFDFTDNQRGKYHVAVVISVQGINPVTGKPITELRLSQYKKQCPIHEWEFHQDRYCPECKFKWPSQNYIATTTGKSHLWLDGFRNESGEVRQYIISEEQARGIAKQIEDKDPEFKRVWAIGFAFYLSKEPKPIRGPSPLRAAMDYPPIIGSIGSSMSQPIADMTLNCKDAVLGFEESTPQTTITQDPKSYGSTSCNQLKAMSAYRQPVPRQAHSRDSAGDKRIGRAGASSCRPPAPVEKVVEKKKLEVGAGARISQDIGVDPSPIDFWQEEPAGMIYINFTDPETLNAILAAGKRQDTAEGALNGMEVGN